MAISVTTSSFTRTDTGFEATGIVNDKAFTARTIKWAGDLIFKLMEPDEDGKLVLKALADSEFTRGERIATARFLKGVREDFESSDLLSVDALSALTAKELRKLAKSRGITGYSAKGVTKADIVAMLAPAAEVTDADAEVPAEVDAAPAEEPVIVTELEVDDDIEVAPVADDDIAASAK